jgi:glycosyltransferase involved in cell wall biosynthesis
MPAISVLLPVRDAGPWLSSSLASLARQSERDLEVIAVDDGSTDGSGERLERAAEREGRLRVVHTPALGLPAALNTALGLARSPLIARHDADDLSHRDRFAAQAAWLRSHPGTAVVGSRVRLFPAGGYGAGMRRWAAWHNALLTHDAMRHEALIDSPLAHGTALLRREALEAVGGWHERGWAEDLDLWLRLFENGARFAKLPRALYGWRQHACSSTRTDRRYARERFVELKVDALARGLLARGRRATLVGVGTSLATWRAALGDRAAAAVEARRASREVFERHADPFVLAYMAPGARDRWRRVANETGLKEGEHFVFVA